MSSYAEAITPEEVRFMMTETYSPTTELNYSPTPEVTEIKSEGQSIFVVRDDLLPGGTKQRAAIPYIQGLKDKDIKKFLYASPFSGFAQVALAYACSQLNVQCHLFCEKTEDGNLHEFSLLAQSYGAQITMCGTLEEAHQKSLAYELKTPAAKTLPLGFDDPVFRKHLEREIKIHWHTLNQAYDIKELWLPIGSGTLLKVFKKIVGDPVKIYGVNVNVLTEKDFRISSLKSDQRIHYIKLAQRFHEPCKDKPPVPSNLYYDAKLFASIGEHASPGAFWWNVAR